MEEKLTRFQEYKVRTERQKDGSIKIVKKEKTDFTTVIYQHEADIMNNGPSDDAVEFGAAAISGLLYLPVSDQESSGCTMK